MLRKKVIFKLRKPKFVKKGPKPPKTSRRRGVRQPTLAEKNNWCIPKCDEKDWFHVETPEKYHKAKIMCKCGKHIKWTCSYEKQEKIKERNEQIDEYCDIFRDLINSKDVSFLQGIKKLKNLTGTQYRRLMELIN
tara:strand:+ start:1419 stop:1823 length:405 start_codon:yes stop_codon:yes gene_type:complete